MAADTQSSSGSGRSVGRRSWLLVLILSTIIGLGSFRYVAGEAVVPPPLRINFADHSLAFFIHIALGSVALVTGPWQFHSGLRARRKELHRKLGWLYVISCVVGGFAGLVMAPGSNGGPVAAVGFGLLAVLWIGSTAMALTAAIRRQILLHRKWMIVSFALTFAGVTLRLYLPIALIDLPSFSETYAIVAWACWVPNLIIGVWLAKNTGRGGVA